MPTNERETDLVDLFDDNLRTRTPRERMIEAQTMYEREQQALRALGNARRSGYMQFTPAHRRAIKLPEGN